MMCANEFEHGFENERFYRNSLNKKLREISYLLEDDSEVLSNLQFQDDGCRQKQFTLEELSKYNGVSGKPAYVSVNGIVYDVSSVKTWAGGAHFGISAGRDATDKFNSCHGSSEILNTLPKVGVMVG
ncbi:hypothetical protein KPL55_00390 [Clostridium lacusfryxellense]|nr:hypothetical protein [Clostridium lacusfryxellense]